MPKKTTGAKTKVVKKAAAKQKPVKSAKKATMKKKTAKVKKTAVKKKPVKKATTKKSSATKVKTAVKKRGPGRPPASTTKKNVKASAKNTTKKTVAKVAKPSVVKALPQKKLSISKAAQKVDKARTKSDVINVLALCTHLPRKDVKSVLDTLTDLMEYDLGKKGPGVFTFNGLLKITKVHKKAVKARKGINPFTKEPIVFKAKPAQKTVKVRPLKALKNLV